MDQEQVQQKVNENALNILLVDDSEADVKIAIRAFKHAKIKNNLFVVGDGIQCIKYLKGEEPYQDKKMYPWPDLILLDINMPKANGFDVLQGLKSEVRLDIVPVIVLSGSKNITDIKKSYEFGANSFIQKPVSYEEFVEFVDGFNYYWNIMNKLPREKV